MKKRINFNAYTCYIQTHSLGKQILQIYLERCLFRLLQAFFPTISFSQILHFRPFKGLRPDFLTRINFHGILISSSTTEFYSLELFQEIIYAYKLCQNCLLPIINGFLHQATFHMLATNQNRKLWVWVWGLNFIPNPYVFTYFPILFLHIITRRKHAPRTSTRM